MRHSRTKKLRLLKSTIRHLTHHLTAVRGGDDVQPVTRAFTDCEYCGVTNHPGCKTACNTCDCSWDPECNCLPSDPRCTCSS